jgi:Plasmid pRiA4b ORF-3-like protein
MSGRWLGIRVDLIGGRGQILDPPPGRTFAVPPSCTFDEFGRAIDLAFARWDLSHLREFTLDDGTLVVNEEMADELRASAFGGAIPRTMLLSAKASPRLKVGSRFRYIFDLGDDWTHACTVEGHLDPLEVLGNIPHQPTAYWGWGTMPDQYGRRWDSDDGVSAPPISRSEEEIELRWSKPPLAPLIDLREFRRAIASGTAAEVLDAVSAVEIETALQQVGAGLLNTYRAASPADQAALSPVLLSVLQRLQRREWEGDDILAAEMLAQTRAEEPNGKPLLIDLDELSTTMADRGEYPGGYLNTQTGEIVAAALADEYAVGEESVVDVEDGIWVHVVDDGRAGWQDMADFAATVEDPQIRQTLEDAAHGKGAFSRFRRAVDRADLGIAWHCFADDRRWGRARQELADLGFRPT